MSPTALILTIIVILGRDNKEKDWATPILIWSNIIFLVYLSIPWFICQLCWIITFTPKHSVALITGISARYAYNSPKVLVTGTIPEKDNDTINA